MIGVAAVLVIIVFGAVIIGAMFSSLGAIIGAALGLRGLHKDKQARRQAAGHPMRSRTFDEIQAAKNGGQYSPDPRFRR